MTTISVSRDAQAIYPDGEQAAFSVYNRGPWTVFIDDKSSINASSYALRPADSLVWPAGVPLWVKGNGFPRTEAVGRSLLSKFYQNSTLVITPNTHALTSTSQATTTFPVASVYAETDECDNIYPMEVDAFQSLTVELVNGTNSEYTSPLNGASIRLSVYWFNEFGDRVATDEYTLPALYNNSPSSNPPEDYIVPARLQFDVRAKYAQLIWAGFDSSGIESWSPVRYRVYGATLRLPQRVDYWAFNNWQEDTDYSPIFLRTLDGSGSTNASGSDTFNLSSWRYADQLCCNAIARTLRVGVRYSGITTAGEIVVGALALGGYNGFPRLATLTIPTGTGTVSTELAVPLSHPYRVFSSGVVGGSMQLSLTWKD